MTEDRDVDCLVSGSASRWSSGILSGRPSSCFPPARAIWGESTSGLGVSDRRNAVSGASRCRELAARIPGGPQAMSSQAFGPTAGFLIMWTYWISVWTANRRRDCARSASEQPCAGIAGPRPCSRSSRSAPSLSSPRSISRGVGSAGSVQVLTTRSSSSAGRGDAGLRCGRWPRRKCCPAGRGRGQCGRCRQRCRARHVCDARLRSRRRGRGQILDPERTSSSRRWREPARRDSSPFSCTAAMLLLPYVEPHDVAYCRRDLPALGHSARRSSPSSA